MEPYRLYILNSLDGLVADERRFIAKDDATAVWIAEGIQHSRAMELWHRGSKIHEWQALELVPSALSPDEEEPVRIVTRVPN
jgi:hypothetical protein